MAASSSADASLRDDEETSLKSILAEVGMDEEWLKKLAEAGVAAPDAVEILNDASCSIHNLLIVHGAMEPQKYRRMTRKRFLKTYSLETQGVFQTQALFPQCKTP